MICFTQEFYDGGFRQEAGCAGTRDVDDPHPSRHPKGAAACFGGAHCSKRLHEDYDDRREISILLAIDHN
jgi:hypothetical protein